MRSFILVLAAIAATGCATAPQKAAKREFRAVEASLVPPAAQSAAATAAPQAAAYRRLNSRWVGHDANVGSVVPPQADLPVVFDNNFVFAASSSLPLSEVTRRIATETGIPVRIMPDVTENTAPRDPVVLWEQGSLRQVLDALAAQTGLEWYYTANEIQLSRIATATWKLDFSLRPTAMSASLGGGGASAGGSGSSQGGGQGGNNVSGTLNTSVDTSLRLDPATTLLERLRTVLTPTGRVAISSVSNTVTVRDLRPNVEAAGRIIQQENALLSRSIEVEVEFVTVSSRDIAEYGLDWNAVYRQIESGVTRWTAGLAGPGSLVSATGGSLQFAVPLQSGTRTAGTSVVVRALSEIGETSTVFKRSVTTGHNQPAPINSVQSQGYLARLTPAPAGGAGLGSGTPGAEQATITTGFQLTVTPTVLSSNRIQVSLALSLSSLDKLEDVSLGGGARIQTPSTSALQFIQAPIMRSGEIYAVQVYERTKNEGSGRTLDRTGVLGTQAGRFNREIVVMIVRPVLLTSSTASAS